MEQTPIVVRNITEDYVNNAAVEPQAQLTQKGGGRQISYTATENKNLIEALIKNECYDSKNETKWEKVISELPKPTRSKQTLKDHFTDMLRAVSSAVQAINGKIPAYPDRSFQGTEEAKKELIGAYVNGVFTELTTVVNISYASKKWWSPDVVENVLRIIEKRSIPVQSLEDIEKQSLETKGKFQQETEAKKRLLAEQRAAELEQRNAKIKREEEFAANDKQKTIILRKSFPQLCI